MSTNPFRQIRNQQDQFGSTGRPPVDISSLTADESGSRPAGTDLSIDTKVPSSLDRHVSFASPPVDTTIPAASYPSSPESVRSPPWHFAQPATPNYRTAFQHDPFEALGQHRGEDRIIQEALQNAQTNATVVQGVGQKSEDDAVRNTLSKFASAPARPPPPPVEPTPSQQSQASKKSMDVDAFKRLLLTGDSASAPSTGQVQPRTTSDNSSATDTTSISQFSIGDSFGAPEDTPRSSHDLERPIPFETAHEALSGSSNKLPPPAPAPRRGKSVKTKPAHDVEVVNSKTSTEIRIASGDRRKPPAPLVPLKQNHPPSGMDDEETSRSPADATSPAETSRTTQKPPPPPPIRRQHSVAQRKASNDLPPTIEEPSAGPAPSTNSRRSSNDRPPPPPSRNSTSSVKRQSLGLMNPPPLPPPRRGRGSSRSSMDSFRPPLASIIGEGEQTTGDQDDVRTANNTERRNLTPSNADSILAELANLQKEVDAARRNG